MTTPAAPRPPPSGRRDLFVLAAFGLLTCAAAWRFALFDRLVEAARRLEGLPLDALPVTILVLTPALGRSAWRRWRETRRAPPEGGRARGGRLATCPCILSRDERFSLRCA